MNATDLLNISAILWTVSNGALHAFCAIFEPEQSTLTRWTHITSVFMATVVVYCLSRGAPCP